MAWNEPGGNNDKDPWGGNRGNDGPPDLDEVIRNFQNKISGLFGGKGGGNGTNNGRNEGGFNGTILIFALVVVAIIYVFAGIYQVDQKERAVVLHLGKYSETKGPGLHWNPPLIDSVSKVDSLSLQEWSTGQQMLTKDLNIVDIRMSVQYSRIDPKAYLLEVRDPEMSLQQAANSALRHVVGSSPMHNVLTEGREQIAVEVRELLQLYLDNYKTGINVDKVNIEEADPPKEVQSAFDDVSKAREDEERLQNEAQTYANGIIPKARGEAQRVIEQATAYKEQVIAQAEGEAKRFEYLLAEYKKAPEVTRRRLYIDTVQEVMENSSKVMVDVEGGNNMFYMPLDQIVKATRTSTAKAATPQDVDAIVDQVMNQLRSEAAAQQSRRRELR
ncbi:FtsH protease activity modulator HflK [Saccharophagus degradans]|uniref:Protein HflK n=2 Tax=Saccharophagus degradans TaxID=86304 RepID=Q21HA4_SACD2|nr:FtsH protease activity modulator HflK [Saccharophagus degradans]ABD81925.1 HflK protein [Saccharophagus degradans 2-40]MBU2987706.1 FtsH protease activity modulator HflK [Saccharophagus degradans]MDO6422545.1 FtsH protease activity modulator HflK [Saccharophagus degradans]MDO6607026.1 FtsH protease activity modulator HflK [Saccharophagus degradans]WGO99871.1 FtsH protease activity modulator HflK [Saccharophagus degradans]